eukprot:1836955-Pyramimonas_sp.AAC.1
MGTCREPAGYPYSCRMGICQETAWYHDLYSGRRMDVCQTPAGYPYPCHARSLRGFVQRAGVFLGGAL